MHFDRPMGKNLLGASLPSRIMGMDEGSLPTQLELIRAVTTPKTDKKFKT
jgi:hypothetical protein